MLGLPAEGNCPECGALVSSSLRGNLLVYSSIEFVAKLSIGARLVIAGLVLFGVWIGGVLLPVVDLGRSPGSRVGISLISVGSSTLSLMGWWLLSTPDPALMGLDKAVSARRVLRVTLVISMAALAVSVFVQWSLGVSYFRSSASWGARVLWIATVVSLSNWPFKTIASLLYVKNLAMRIPSMDMAERARNLIRFAIGGSLALALVIAVLLILTSSGVLPPGAQSLAILPGCGTVLGVIVWTCVYAFLLLSLRVELGAIAIAQKSFSATPG